MAHDRERASSPRGFFLRGPPVGGTAELLPEEAEHALRVLRLAPGDAILGLDGRGGAWPLRLVAGRSRAAVLELAGEPQQEPAPGEPGARLPWIEIACGLPRGSRAEEMLDRLVQLGIAALTPLESERTQPGRGVPSPARARRLERVAREAAKQSGRRWLPAIGAPCTVAELCARLGSAAAAVLDPAAGERLVDAAAGLARAGGTRERPILAIAGPEGGLTPAEGAALVAAGARPAWLAPHVLRIETAAEAAAAVLVQTLERPGSQGPSRADPGRLPS